MATWRYQGVFTWTSAVPFKVPPLHESTRALNDVTGYFAGIVTATEMVADIAGGFS